MGGWCRQCQYRGGFWNEAAWATVAAKMKGEADKEPRSDKPDDH